MNTASLELCKELYELSKWEDPSYWWNYDGRTSAPNGETDYRWYLEPKKLPSHKSHYSHPAYDLGYLIRKLPLSSYIATRKSGGATASTGNAIHDGKTCCITERGATPENAACSLAIKLFQEGVLK